MMTLYLKLQRCLLNKRIGIEVLQKLISFTEDYCSERHPLHRYKLLTGKENFITHTLYDKIGYIDDNEPHLSKRLKK